MPKGFSAKLPLSYSKTDGPYVLTKTLEENARQNLKNLILTIPGERVMNSDFGVGFSSLLFENSNNQIIEDLRDMGFDEMVSDLERNPPEKEENRLTLVPLVDRLLEAQEDTNSMSVALHTLPSLINPQKRERLGNLIKLLKDGRDKSSQTWWNKLQRDSDVV